MAGSVHGRAAWALPGVGGGSRKDRRGNVKRLQQHMVGLALALAVVGAVGLLALSAAPDSPAGSLDEPAALTEASSVQPGGTGRGKSGHRASQAARRNKLRPSEPGWVARQQTEDDWELGRQAAGVAGGGATQPGGGGGAGSLASRGRGHAPGGLTRGGHQGAGLLEVEQLPESDPIAQFPPRIDGRWASGYPRIGLDAKRKLKGFGAGLQLLLFRADVSRLKAQLLSLPEADWGFEEQARSNAHLAGRDANRNNFKPGARAILLQFSDNAGESVVRFPWYYRFQELVEPLVKQVLGEDDMSKIIRMQLAYMPPHTQINRHQDKGGYAARAHRIHVVVATNPDVVFALCRGGAEVPADALEALAAMRAAGAAAAEPACLPIHTEEGRVFELNNRLRHFVVNGGEAPRIHLVVDVAETPRNPPLELRAGQVCQYDKEGKIVC